MPQRNASWSKWDELNKGLNSIKREYARQAVIEARRVLGDGFFANADLRLAAIANFDANYEIALEICRIESKLAEQNA